MPALGGHWESHRFQGALTTCHSALSPPSLRPAPCTCQPSPFSLDNLGSRSRQPCLVSQWLRHPGKPLLLKFRTCQESGALTSAHELSGCSGVSVPGLRLPGAAPPPRPGPAQSPRSSHRVELVAATKSPPHSCPPDECGWDRTPGLRRPAGPRAPPQRRPLTPRPPRPPLHPEFTHLFAKSQQRAPSLAVCALAWTPARRRLYRTPPFVSEAHGPLPSRGSRRPRPTPRAPASQDQPCLCPGKGVEAEGEPCFV